MDLSSGHHGGGGHHDDLPMPLTAQYSAIHETAAKLKLLATTSGQQQQQQQLAVVNNGGGGGGGGSGGISGGMGGGISGGMSGGESPDTRAAREGKAVRYRECQKNHAAAIGGHALDGCGEFAPLTDGGGGVDALRCGACDCHRNFHRREVDGEPRLCRDCDRKRAAGKLPHAALLMEHSGGDDVAAAFHTPGGGGAGGGGAASSGGGSGSGIKKRFRTKFTPEQKERMLSFADKLGWRIQKHDEAEVQQFVNEVGVKRHVLKVWMHNNKHTLGKK